MPAPHLILTHAVSRPPRLKKAAVVANDLLIAAQAQATAIVQDAELEAHAIRADAVRESNERRTADALALAVAEEQAHRELLRGLEDQTVDVVLFLLEEVLAGLSNEVRQSLAPRIHRALTFITDVGAIALAIHADDAAIHESALAALKHNGLRIDIDSHLAPGTACLRLASGELHLCVQQHLRLLADSLHDRIHNLLRENR